MVRYSLFVCEKLRSGVSDFYFGGSSGQRGANGCQLRTVEAHGVAASVPDDFQERPCDSLARQINLTATSTYAVLP